MAKKLIYYSPHAVAAAHSASNPLPGIDKFIKFFKFYNDANSAIFDRSSTFRTPVRMKNLFPIPIMRPFKKSLEEVCNDRARQLLEASEAMSVSLNVMWSGGIDSTLVLVSLLKNATVSQKKRIVVLLTEDSIAENPKFYATHLRGCVKIESSDTLPYILGSSNLLVGGEGNDQIFGSGAPHKKLVEDYPPGTIRKPYSRDLFFELYSRMVQDTQLVNFFLDIHDRLRAAAPIELSTNGDVAWWEKFCTKWQAVYTRKLTCVAPRNVSLMTHEWITNYYRQFYMTEEFQLWSMNNLDKRIKDSWKSYKWLCKDIIYDFTKDAEYRDNKTKWGSLGNVFRQRQTYSFIDESLQFYTSLDPEEYFEPENNFR